MSDLLECSSCDGRGWLSNDGGGLDPYGFHPCRDCLQTGINVEDLLARMGINKRPEPTNETLRVSASMVKAMDWLR